ncbi:hypothetical protein BDQ17DRAFT_1541039 [Cyathus striatus]|nr:hypothetical protein BDQ17DRAFT_1541039 [Cyathus striatus]
MTSEARSHGLLTTASSQHSSLEVATALETSCPISRLPNEILIQIFQRYLDSNPRSDEPSHPESSCITSYPRTDSTPLRLTHVCWLWKHLAVSTSLLWSSIAVYSPRPEHIPLLRLWLHYANSCLLSISIRQSDSNSGDSGQINATDAILRMFIDRCHLWKSIDMIFWDFQEALMNIPPDSMKTLEHARLLLLGTPEVDKIKIWAKFYSSPRLSSVKWSFPFYCIPDAPWEQLKIIHCTCAVPMFDFLHVLKSCRSLEVLKIPVGGCLSAGFPPSEIVVLPALRELDLGDCHIDFPIIFETISAPRLAFLTIQSINPGFHYRITLHRFLERSKCTLRSFNLLGNRFQASELLAWLHMPGLSSVTELNLPGRFQKDAKNICYHPEQTYMEAVIARIKELASRENDCYIEGKAEMLVTLRERRSSLPCTYSSSM